jgi:hypothetical protein
VRALKQRQMRSRRTYYPIVICCVIGLVAPAGAAAAPRISATPETVARNAIQTVHGRGWPVIEFCSRTIRVFVKSPQNVAPIAQRHIRDNGRFTFRWIPKNKNIGRGNWTMVARMRCESGEDGSTHFVRATTRITID